MHMQPANKGTYSRRLYIYIYIYIQQEISNGPPPAGRVGSTGVVANTYPAGPLMKGSRTHTSES